ncbi:MAG: transporter substrate-binding domain-containing protein [Kiritimatiellia bacterium]
MLLSLLSVIPAYASPAIRVGAQCSPPLIFITSDGHTSGLFPELLENIAEQHGWEIEYVHGSQEENHERLIKGDIDLVANMKVSGSQRSFYKFSSEPVFINWGTAFSRSDIRVCNLKDLNGRRIALEHGGSYNEGPKGIRSVAEQTGLRCQFIEVDDAKHILMLLDSKQADIGVVSRLYGSFHAHRYDITATPIIFAPQILTFAASINSERGCTLLEQIDKTLKIQKQSAESFYHKIMTFYLGGATRNWPGKEEYYNRKFQLTQAEQRWIKEHPKIRFSIDPGFEPFEIMSGDSGFSGMAADFMNLLSQKTGLKFVQISHETWPMSVNAIRNKEIDLLPCIGRSRKRENFLSYSTPYLEFARVIITRLDSPIRSLDDLRDAETGVQSNSSHHAFLRENTNINPILYKTFSDCLMAVSSGEIDAAVGNLAVTTHFTRKLSLTNIMLAGYADQEPHSLSFGVRKDWPELTSIIDKFLTTVTLRQRNDILSEWLPLPAASSSEIDLDREEREWLLMHPRIHVGWDNSWAPIEFADKNGQARGIAIDYLKELEKILGVQFVMERADNWQITSEKLKTRELDMCSCLAITPERLKLFSFTDTYLESPVVCFGNSRMTPVHSLSQLRGMKVAVVRDYATDEWISRNYPDLTITYTENVEKGIRLLSEGDVDVFAGSLIVGNYYLSQLRKHDIKIIGETGYSYKLRMAVRNDWPLFKNILQKALSAMPETEKNALYLKWVKIRCDHGFNYHLLRKVSVIALLVILIFFYWNRRLAREISIRRKAQESLIQSEKALQKSYSELRKMGKLKENLTHMVVHDIRSPLASISASLELLSDDIPENGNKDENNKFLLMAKINAQKIADMAQDLLDISRLEEGCMPLNKTEFDIKELAQTAAQNLESQTYLENIELKVSGKETVCNADANIIQRVLINLISNAIAVTPQNGSVKIQVNENEDYVSVEVNDSGPGIPEELRKNLFDKFASISNKKREGTSSVGLGLTFCKMAVEAHNGHIEVESTIGSGSSFRFYLPK